MKPGQSIDASRTCKLPCLRSTLKAPLAAPGFRCHGFIVLILLFSLLAHCGRSSASIPASTCSEIDPDFLILIKDGDGIQQIGNVGLASKKLDPASTIKPALALALLQDGFDPEREILVKDKFIEGTPRRIALSEALLYSSNDYFRTVAREKGGEFFRNSLAEMAFFPEPLPASWPSALEEIVHGGDERTTAIQQLNFVERLLQGGIPESDRLLPLIEWPRTQSDREIHPDLHLYGKTGAWNQTVWFVGGAKQGKEVRSVVIVTRGHWTRRKQAIHYFYCSFAQKLPVHPLIP